MKRKGRRGIKKIELVDCTVVDIRSKRCATGRKCRRGGCRKSSGGYERAQQRDRLRLNRHTVENTAKRITGKQAGTKTGGGLRLLESRRRPLDASHRHDRRVERDGTE